MGCGCVLVRHGNISESDWKNSNYRCRTCRYELNKKWREDNRDRTKNNRRAWNAANPELKKATDYKSHVWKTYGLTMDQLSDMLKSQSGACANNMCRKPLELNTRTCHIDHNHSTGEVRGLLCARCNLGVGVLERPDYPGLVTYLDSFNQKLPSLGGTDDEANS